MPSNENRGLFMVRHTGSRVVVIREFDPAKHPTQAQSPNNLDRPAAWARALELAAAKPKHYDPIARKARDIVFVEINGEQRVVHTAEQVTRPDAPKHHYTVTLKVRRTGAEVTTQEQGSNKKQATDAARAKITVGATTLVSCVKGARVDAQPQQTQTQVPQVTTTSASTAMPWE